MNSQRNAPSSPVGIQNKVNSSNNQEQSMEKFNLDEPMTLAEVNSKRKAALVNGTLLGLIGFIVFAVTMHQAGSAETLTLTKFLTYLSIAVIDLFLMILLCPDAKSHLLLKPDGKEISSFMEMANKQGFEELHVYASKIAKLDRLPTQGEYEAFEKWISEAKMQSAVNEFKSLSKVSNSA